MPTLNFKLSTTRALWSVCHRRKISIIYIWVCIQPLKIDSYSGNSEIFGSSLFASVRGSNGYYEVFIVYNHCNIRYLSVHIQFIHTKNFHVFNFHCFGNPQIFFNSELVPIYGICKKYFGFHSKYLNSNTNTSCFKVLKYKYKYSKIMTKYDSYKNASRKITCNRPI